MPYWLRYKTVASAINGQSRCPHRGAGGTPPLGGRSVTGRSWPCSLLVRLQEGEFLVGESPGAGAFQVVRDDDRLGLHVDVLVVADLVPQGERRRPHRRHPGLDADR